MLPNKLLICKVTTCTPLKKSTITTRSNAIQKNLDFISVKADIVTKIKKGSTFVRIHIYVCFATEEDMSLYILYFKNGK